MAFKNFLQPPIAKDKNIESVRILQSPDLGPYIEVKEKDCTINLYRYNATISRTAQGATAPDVATFKSEGGIEKIEMQKSGVFPCPLRAFGPESYIPAEYQTLPPDQEAKVKAQIKQTWEAFADLGKGLVALREKPQVRAEATKLQWVQPK